MSIFQRSFLVLMFLFSTNIFFGMEVDCFSHLRLSESYKRTSTEKIVRKKENLKRLIYERITAVQKGEKEKSFLDEPKYSTTHFYKTLLTKAVKYSLEKEINLLLQEGADPLCQGKPRGPMSEVKNTATAQLLLQHSDNPHKYNIAFAMFLRSFDTWHSPEERSAYLTSLLEYVDPNEQSTFSNNKENLPLITLAIGDTFWHQPAKQEIALLIQHGADPDQKDTELNKSPNECFKIVNPSLVAFMQEERKKYIDQNE